MPLFSLKRFLISLLLMGTATLLLPEWAPAQQGTPGSWCILRRHNVYEPPNCFEFYLCDTTKDTQRCGFAAGGACGVGQLGLREGWQVDPSAHPQLTPGPYMTWEGGDYVMNVLNRFGGNWYQCNGPRTKELPQRAVVRDGASEPGFCVLRKHISNWPSNCYEFYLAAGGAGRAVIQGGVCFVTSLAARESWEIDPNAHPQLTPGPYMTWEGGDYVVTVLSRFGGNWYQCNGPRTKELPQRTPVRDGPTEPGFCILRKPIPNWPPNCFEFYLAVAGEGRAVIQGGICFVTSLAARENWTVDPTMGGPYLQRGQAQAAHDRLHRFAGNFYGCPGETPPPPPPPNGGGGTPREWGTFSGGLEESVVQQKVQARRKEGTTATFQSNPVTLTISQNGQVSITGNVVFEGSLRNDRTGLTDTRRATFTLYNGSCKQGSCSGKMTWFVEGFWPHMKPPGNYKREKPAEGTWNASRQKDGSWVLGLPNGIAPLWAEIPYRLK